MSNGNGHRWSKFWWQDWMRDEGLRSCGFAAQGLWMRMLCIAHEAEPCGHVLINGKPPSLKKLASMGSTTEKEVAKLLAELEHEGVFSRTEEGTIYSRRMVRDSAASDAGREHIAKRWKDERPTSPPNRGGNRDATSRPNWEAYSPPNSPPIFPPDPPYQEAEAEPEEDEERKENKNSVFGKNARARGLGQQEIVPNGLDELLSDAGIEPPPRLDRSRDGDDKLSADPALATQIRRVAKACRIDHGPESHTKSEQILAAVSMQPQDVTDEVPPPVPCQPAEPVRSVEEQRAALLASCTAEQIAKAQRYMARVSA